MRATTFEKSLVHVLVYSFLIFRQDSPFTGNGFPWGPISTTLLKRKTFVNTVGPIVTNDYDMS